LSGKVQKNVSLNQLLAHRIFSKPTRTIIFWMTNFSKESAWQEARHLINLAIPTVIVQLGATIPPALTASYVGRHLGSTYLDGFTLANLTGNLCTLSLLSGLYSASDTLAPQAFGAGNYRELGLLLMRGLTGSMIVLIPINLVLLMYMEQLLVLCGQDPVPSALAAKWYSIYLLSLPFYALYMVTWKFLSAQAIMTPLVVILIVTLLSLPLLLETFVTTFGFLGSALAILTYMLSLVAKASHTRFMAGIRSVG
jgi:multidrug resistance protein, MATE family